MIKILHITGHYGTSKNIDNIFNNLNIKYTIKTFYHSYGFFISEEEANEIWNENSLFFKQYDLIIITDTAVCARIFFQNMDKHNCKIIVYLPMPFDCPHRHLLKLLSNKEDDFQYIKLYREASLNENVLFISDNRYHQHHAEIQGINFLFKDIFRPIPIIEEVCDYKDNKIFLLNKRNFIENYQNNLVDIDYKIYDQNQKFKNHQELRVYKGMLHLPYQVNIMQLWENIGANIIHFIPSKKFIKKLIWENKWYSWEEKYRDPCLFEKSLELSEWYQADNEEYFVYFEDWKDLKFKINNLNYLEKKQLIYNKIIKSNIHTIQKWKAVISYLFN